ncbi:AI-2E family transporter [Kineococcus rubinsiae]|uniref:AI-2E family transporter n=1 Tax=Kineococcus rubinsiae TaxID=2609562 RepID=UPI0014318C37|nr:AI-2E family transporter [Kineococcus rubinsiae]NIZ89587.1 AI-2E family transporter [Kineococcus rubinsiae]
MSDPAGPPPAAPPPVPARRATPHRRSPGPVERGVTDAARWTLRLLVLGVGFSGLLWLLGQGWSLLLPLLLAVLLSAVLWPLTQVLRAVLPRSLAALVTLLLLVVAVLGVFAALVPNVAGQAQDISDSATAGLAEVQDYVTGPPLNLGETQIDVVVAQVTTELQANAQGIAGGIVSGVGSVGSGVVTALLVLVLTYFCLADGDRLLPWSRRWLDERSHRHLSELGTRTWAVLRGYILSQAAVALVDALFIGIGLRIVGVPLALPLAVVVFFAAFIPIVGAVASGALAVLVALVALGWVQALIVLGIVLLVQQLEGNVLQPLLVGRSLALHPAVVIGSVTVGGTLFGITGAFLAVPFTAIVTVVLRYVRSELVPGAAEDPPVEERPGGRRRRVPAPPTTP